MTRIQLPDRFRGLEGRSLRYTPNSGSHAKDRLLLAAFFSLYCNGCDEPDFDVRAAGGGPSHWGLLTGRVDITVPEPLPPRLLLVDGGGVKTDDPARTRPVERMMASPQVHLRMATLVNSGVPFQSSKADSGL